METVSPAFIVIACATCEGDSRRSRTCRVCSGAGIGVPARDGLLVWSASVDSFTIALRKVTRVTNVIFHMSLLAFVLFTIVFFAWQVGIVENFSLIATREYWITSSWHVTLLWLGLLVACFLMFRISEYTRDARPLPTWGAKKPREETNHRFDIEPYFSPSSLDLIEDAYRIAASLKRTTVTPHALFAAALARPVGGLFLFRLNLSFDILKSWVAHVLHRDPEGNPPITFSPDLKRTLACAYANASMHDRKHVSPIELFLQSFQDSPHIQEVFHRAGVPSEHVRRVAKWIRLEERLQEDEERLTRMNRAMPAKQTPFLDRYSADLTRMAHHGVFRPMIGREREMNELLSAIERGCSVALLGESDASKMALVEQLAHRMAEEDRRLVSVNLTQVISAGDPEFAAERFLALLTDVRHSGNTILILSGIETLIDIDRKGEIKMSECLARELEARSFIVIVTTTAHAWNQYIERRSLGALFTTIDVPELDPEEKMAALMMRCHVIESQYHVFFSYTALDLLSKFEESQRAFDLLPQTAIATRNARGENAFVTAEDIATLDQRR